MHDVSRFNDVFSLVGDAKYLAFAGVEGHFWRLVRSCWRVVTSYWYLMGRYKRQSSAKRQIPDETQSGRSLINN